MTTIGIDPGLSGGIAYVSDSGAEAIPMPILDKRPDMEKVAQFLEGLDIGLVVIEKVQLRPGESGTSALTIGRNVGIIIGWLMAKVIPYEEVPAQTWKKAVGATCDSKAKPKEKKAASVAAARRLFPQVELVLPRCKNYHDGMAEALLIAEYGRRKR